MTPQEEQWANLLMDSVAEVRMLLLDGQPVRRNAWLHLLNRAEALVWHLRERDTDEANAVKINDEE